MNVIALYRGRKTWWPSFTSWRPRILGVGCKLNGVEAKVDDYDELGDIMTRWKDVAWFWLSREGDEDGKDLESKIDDVMVTRSLQGGDGAACNKFLASTVSGLMAYFVTILTLDSARSCVMQCTLPTQGMRSVISTVSISPEGFLPSILMPVVIIFTVVIVVVTFILVVAIVAIIWVVIVVTIIRVVVVVMIIEVVGVVVVSSIIKLSFVIIGSLLNIVLCYLIH
ncbi:hypothetical protein Tco_1282704 [Tanacetum coccineum]